MSSSVSPDDELLALAGLFQATALVDAIARTGSANEDALRTSIGSIYAQDAPSVLDVYGGAGAKLDLGVSTLATTLARGSTRDAATRNAFLLLLLERKLSRRPDLIRTLGHSVADARRQADHLGALHDQIITRLADLYRGTVSTLRPRIIVQGQPVFLQQPLLVARIRALLLAGIRSAVLWHQLGGRRWHLLLRRGRLAAQSRALEATLAGSR